MSFWRNVDSYKLRRTLHITMVYLPNFNKRFLNDNLISPYKPICTDLKHGLEMHAAYRFIRRYRVGMVQCMPEVSRGVYLK